MNVQNQHIVLNSNSTGLDIVTSGNSGLYFRDNEDDNKGYI